MQYQKHPNALPTRLCLLGKVSWRPPKTCRSSPQNHIRVVQVASSLRGTHPSRWGASPPTSIDGFPGEQRPFAPPASCVEKKSSMGWVAAKGPPTLYYHWAMTQISASRARNGRSIDLPSEVWLIYAAPSNPEPLATVPGQTLAEN